MDSTYFGLHVRRKAKAALLLPLLAFVAGCSVYTEPHTDAERKKNAQSDLKMMFTDQEPVTGAMDFGEVVARAVRYNLDHRLKIVEQAFAAGEFRLARYDMLPRIVGQSGYAGRTNHSGSTSTSLLTGEQSLEASTSQDRDRITGRLSAVWNVLDFGVAYARAQQSSDHGHHGAGPHCLPPVSGCGTEASFCYRT